MRPDYVADLARIPSRRLAHLRSAIGLRLVEIERRFWVDDARSFAPDAMGAFFARGVGATEIQFDGGLRHGLVPEPEWLSVLVLDAPLDETFGTAFRASRLESTAPLRSALGRRCVDVRIWRYEDGVDSNEPKECALSYVLEGDVELVYGMYLDGTDDDVVRLQRSDARTEQHTVVSIRAR